jgi:hypothetical protein
MPMVIYFRLPKKEPNKIDTIDHIGIACPGTPRIIDFKSSHFQTHWCGATNSHTMISFLQTQEPTRLRTTEV